MKKMMFLLALLALSTTASAQLKKVEIASASATSYQSGEEAARAIDGNYSTLWHSNYSATTMPVTLTLTFSDVTHVDVMRYVPRTSGTNGNWGRVVMEYAQTTSTAASAWTTVGTYELNGSSSPYDFELGETGADVKRVRFKIQSGAANFVSAAEVEAYALDYTKYNAFKPYFADELLTELKPEVTSSDGIEDADVKALVDNLLNDGDYKKFRVGEYEPYRTVTSLKDELKTSAQYNNWENPTGIYLTTGESCYVMVTGVADDKVGIKIKNWVENEDASSYALRNGLNLITATTEGNLFVDYYTDNFESAPHVQLHFINAPVRGYWDQQTMTNDDWKAMLASLPSDNSVIITRSEHAQLAFPVSAWKQYCPVNVDSVMTLYEQVQWAERYMMGLTKYGREAKNRQLFFATTYGFMAATGIGAYCHVGSLKDIMTPDAAKFGFWGVGHEWGHNNQITPGFKWSGCGETTNNIYASWAQFLFTGDPSNYRLEDEYTGVGEYAGLRGGRMQVYFEEGLRKGVQWQLQDGPDYNGTTPTTKTVMGQDYDGNNTTTVTTTSRNYDHFVKLTPFWQLNLWGIAAGNCPDIIPMVIESIRSTENYATTYNTNGKQQVNWMRLACDSARLDLLPFFEKAGMLKPIDAYIEDYGAGWNKISQAMIDNLKAHVAAMGYPAVTEEINYINGHNYTIYRDKLPLSVPDVMGSGCSYANGKVTVRHSVVKNAVAFETYNSADDLIRITMYGLGSDAAHSYTQVLYPGSPQPEEAAAYIVAVGYDGTRQKIFEKDNLQKGLQENAFYRLTSNSKAGVLSCGANTYVDAEGNITWAMERATLKATALDQIWQWQERDGMTYLYNPQSDAYFGGNDNSAVSQLLTADDAPAWEVACVDEDAATFVFNKKGTGQYLNAYNTTNTGFWSGGAGDPNNIWKVTEVESIKVTIPSVGYYTACYPFDLQLPEGLQAYTCGEIKTALYEHTEYTYAVLNLFEGNVLPARVPVVLSGAAGSYELRLIGEASDTQRPATNLLHGTTLQCKGLEKSTVMFNVSAAAEAGATATIKVTANAISVPANRAYMLTTELDNINQVYLMPEGSMTAIDQVDANVTSAPETLYELNGLPATHLLPGRLYINAKGKKVMLCQ